MDMFIDRFSQKKTAQEMIMANTAAEAEEYSRLSEQVSSHEKTMQEICKINSKNLENMEMVRQLLEESVRGMENARRAESGSERALEAAIRADIRDGLEVQQKVIATQQAQIINMVEMQGENMSNALHAQEQAFSEKTAEVTAQFAALEEKFSAQLQKLEESMRVQIAEQVSAQLASMQGTLHNVETAVSEEVKTAICAQKDEIAQALSRQAESLQASFAEQEAAAKEHIEAQQEALKAADDFTHREAVKVYRNVQAYLEETLPKQTEELGRKMEETAGGKAGGALLPIAIVAMIAALGTVGIEIARIFGVL